METIEANFVELRDNMSEVVLEHVLWGKQTFKCDNLKFINDEERLGVIIKGREIFVFKKNIIYKTDNQVSDGRLTIKIVNKL